MAFWIPGHGDFGEPGSGYYPLPTPERRQDTIPGREAEPRPDPGCPPGQTRGGDGRCRDIVTRGGPTDPQRPTTPTPTTPQAGDREAADCAARGGRWVVTHPGYGGGRCVEKAADPRQGVQQTDPAPKQQVRCPNGKNTAPTMAHCLKWGYGKPKPAPAPAPKPQVRCPNGKNTAPTMAHCIKWGYGEKPRTKPRPKPKPAPRQRQVAAPAPAQTAPPPRATPAPKAPPAQTATPAAPPVRAAAPEPKPQPERAPVEEAPAPTYTPPPHEEQEEKAQAPERVVPKALPKAVVEKLADPGPTPEERRATAAEHARALLGDLPELDPSIGRVDPFVAPSLGDVVTSGDFVNRVRSQTRNIRALAEASGMRGAPVLSAAAGSRSALLSDVADRMFGRKLGEWRANFDRGQDEFNRYRSTWGAKWEPVKAALDYGLAEGRLDLGDRAQALQQQAQQFQNWWLPTGQQRAFQHAGAQRVGGEAHSAALQKSAQDHAARLQAAGFSHADAQRSATEEHVRSLQAAGFDHATAQRIASEAHAERLQDRSLEHAEDTQKRAQDHASRMQAAGFTHAGAMQRSAQEHAAALQAAGFSHADAQRAAAEAHAAAQQGRTFEHDRWRVGQNNLLSLLESIYGQRFSSSMPLPR